MTLEQSDVVNGKVVTKNVAELEIRGVNCLDWNDNILALGHELGVTVLSPSLNSSNPWSFEKSYEYLRKPVLKLRFRGSKIAAVHADRTISEISLSSDPSLPNALLKLGGSLGHQSFINDVDISPQGYIASTGDDKKLILWTDGQPTAPYRLASPGLAVKFWEDQDSDRLLVLEEGNKIRIFDWRKGQWVVTVFVGPEASIKGMGIYDGDIIAIGQGWWKSYHLPSLKGGAGYTFTYDDGAHVGGTSTDLVAYSNSRYVAYGSPSGVIFHDIGNAGEHGVKIEFDLSTEIQAIALRSQGDLCALSTATSVYLFKKL
jgi:WD40 repeat protein